MSFLVKIKSKLSYKDIRQQKSQKMAETERFLHNHRQVYRSAVPLGFKSRTTAGYHFSRAGR